MATIQAMLDNVNKLDVRSESIQIVIETSEDILDFNREQLYSGLDVDGNKLENRYSNVTYALDKERMNQKPGFGVMDFHLTGGFYRGFFLSVKQDSFITDSSDEKTDKLVRLQPGQQIFGISGQNTYKYSRGPFLAKLQDYIKSVTGLSFK